MRVTGCMAAACIALIAGAAHAQDPYAAQRQLEQVQRTQAADARAQAAQSQVSAQQQQMEQQRQQFELQRLGLERQQLQAQLLLEAQRPNQNNPALPSVRVPHSAQPKK